MGLFAMGNRAFGMSLGDDVNVVNEAPGPHSISAWKPGAGNVACGMVSRCMRAVEGHAGRYEAR